jgi:hypothetical protein
VCVCMFGVAAAVAAMAMVMVMVIVMVMMVVGVWVCGRGVAWIYAHLFFFGIWYGGRPRQVLNCAQVVLFLNPQERGPGLPPRRAVLAPRCL